MPIPAPNFPTEAFGLPLASGPLAGRVLDQLERRRKDRLCPFLMAVCPRPYPICSISEGGTPIAICPHRLLEGRAVFRALASWLPGARPTLLRHVHADDGTGLLGWILFDANRSDLWIGVMLMTPLPVGTAGLAEASHDVFFHGRVDDDGYPLYFDWPASTSDGSDWILRVADWTRLWQRPVYSFTPSPLLARLRALLELQGTSAAPVALTPADLEREASGVRLRVPQPPAPQPSLPERGGMWRALVRRRSEWISLRILNGIVMDASSDRSVH